MKNNHNNELTSGGTGRFFMSAKISRFEATKAIITTEDGQELTWSVKNLPDKISPDTPLNLKISLADDNNNDQQELATSLLNELLNPGPA